MTDEPAAGSADRPARVVVVGGGLAGLAAAVALARYGQRVTLLEARRHLGGRAASFQDPKTGRFVDLCRHVGMGCCTNLADFCARTGIADQLERSDVLHFFPAEGRPVHIRACRWLPAPLHLLPALLKLGYLSRRERFRILWALARLARLPVDDRPDTPTIGRWLAANGQSPRAMERFWSVILVSAVGESLDRIARPVAQKVFVEGFMATRTGHELLLPRVPLRELFDQRLAPRLTDLGVRLYRGAPADRVEGTADHVTGVRLAGGRRHAADAVVLAVSWRHVAGLLPENVTVADLVPDPTEQSSPRQNGRPVPLPRPAAGESRMDVFPSSSITAVHLWFDRPVTLLPHAVLVGRLGQWVFHGGPQPPAVPDSGGEHHYQVVISGSDQLASWPHQAILDRVTEELLATWPTAQDARRTRGYVVTAKDAVFSPRPGLDPIRPSQRTRVPGLVLCGDWTATGWPATMESAVRSGNLAAEAVLAGLGIRATILAPDQRRGKLVRWLLGNPRRL